VWAQGDLAVVTAGPVVHLVDLTNASNPEFHTLALDGGNEAWDVKVQDGLLYAGVQVSEDGSALLIYNVSDPASPVLVGRFQAPGVDGAHNLFVRENVAFLAATGQGRAGLTGVWMVDVSDPANPRDLGPLLDGTGEDAERIRAHDLTVIGNRAYIAGWDSGIWIVDFENLDDPSELSYEVIAHHKYEPALRTFNFPDPATHNVWPSTDGRLLWTTDEIVGEGIRLFDISDPANFKLLDFYRLDGLENALPHNVIVDGEFAYAAHYMDGLRVLQAVDGRIVEAAARDTAGNNERSNPFRGAFGVFPLNDLVLIADTFNGLLIYAKDDLLN